MPKDIRALRRINVYVCANICSIQIHHCVIFGGSGNNLDQKLEPNSRMIAHTSLPMTPTSFSSYFPGEYAISGEILKMAKNSVRTDTNMLVPVRCVTCGRQGECVHSCGKYTVCIRTNTFVHTFTKCIHSLACSCRQEECKEKRVTRNGISYFPFLCFTLLCMSVVYVLPIFLKFFFQIRLIYVKFAYELLQIFCKFSQIFFLI